MFTSSIIIQNPLSTKFDYLNNLSNLKNNNERLFLKTSATESQQQQADSINSMNPLNLITTKRALSADTERTITSSIQYIQQQNDTSSVSSNYSDISLSQDLCDPTSIHINNSTTSETR